MGGEISDFINVDGVHHREDEVLRMAKNCGNYVVAEHYIGAILFHAIAYSKNHLIEMVNEIREAYHVPPLPTPGKNPASRNNMPGRGSLQEDADLLSRKLYQKMTVQKRWDILRESLTSLRLEDKGLFNNKSCWMGIMMVVRDRLDPSQNMSGLYDFSGNMMPSDWPATLKPSETTGSNFSKKVDVKDRGLAYFEMENNPWKELCDTFWDILKKRILQEIYESDTN